MKRSILVKRGLIVGVCVGHSVWSLGKQLLGLWPCAVCWGQYRERQGLHVG
jgi:xanthosine utilization system XapX-like protein